MQSVDLIETNAYATTKDLVSEKEQTECSNIIKWHKNDWLWWCHKRKHNSNWPEIPDHLYRILIIGGSGSRKTNSLFKGCVHYIFTSLFFKSKWELGKQGKMFFISIQKLFLFFRKSNFRILDIQISWHHQMLKHKTISTFYWITWEVNTVC